MLWMLTCTASLGALDSSLLPSQYLITSWQEELPQRTVNTLVQTRDGYLWLGTQDGLVRYDGLRFVVFDRGNTPALESQDVRALLEDEAGRLWIGTRGGGLLVYEAGVVRRVEDPGWPDEVQAVHALCAGPDGSLWVGTRGAGLVRWQDGRFERLGLDQELPADTLLPDTVLPDTLLPDTVLSLLADAAGGLWVGTHSHGLYRWDGERLAAQAQERLAADSVLSLARDSEGTLWIGTRESGMLRWPNAPAGEPVAVPDSASAPIMSLLSDRDGNLWAGSYGQGLYRTREGEIVALGPAEGLSSANVMSLLEDREGNLWAGTEGGGLDRLQVGTFRSFGTPEGLGSDQVWTVLEDESGAIWIGTDDGGLSRLQNNTVTTLTSADGLGSDSVSALAAAPGGELWVGVRGAGLDLVRGDRISHLGAEQGLASDTIFSMHRTADGDLWLATRSEGLVRRRGGSFEPVVHPPTLPADVRIWAFAETPAGELLVATDGHGLAVLRDGELSRSITTADGLSSDTLSAIHVGDDGALWLGTYGAGLNLVRGDTVHTFTVREGLFDDVILRILPDRAGHLWMSCNRGVFRVSVAELEAVAAGTLERVRAVAFGTADGMRSAECNGFLQPAGYAGRDGRLWFPTVEGAVVVDPRAIEANPVPPGVVIETATMDGEPLALAVEPELAATAGRLEVRFTGLSFVRPEEMRFRYRLAGYDDDWVESDGERRATYTNLPTGRSYRFSVLAANADGVWSEQAASFAFSIAPHLWQRPAFQLLAVVLLGLLSWGVYSLRVRQLVRRTRRLEALVDEATAEVVARRDELEQANQELSRLNQFKTEFLGIAAHDLKNPLTVIHADAGRIAGGAVAAGRLDKAASRISGSARQMLNIVNDLLDTTAIESGKLTLHRQATDINALVAGVIERNRAAADEREIAIEVALPPQPLAVSIDPEKVARIADNLVSNAVKYSRRGGTVRVTLAAGEAPARATGEVPAVRLSVEDQGPGLTAEQRGRLFHRFGRLESEPGGATSSTGLGLFIVQQFVDLHGGRVEVASEAGRGSTFTVELPGS
jgi:signal transduction histidine kinase/ligand-binding sensor domain-containing protein